MPLIRLLILALSMTAIPTAYGAALTGRSIAEVLDEARAAGIIFIYSSQLLPDSMQVLAEPGSPDLIGQVREILAAHGLGLKQAAPRVFAVVTDAAAKIDDPPPATGSTASPSRLEEVIVQTSRYAFAIEQSVTPTLLTQEQVKDMPRLADETLRAVQRLPGTASNGFSSLGPVRGGDGNEVGIILDGLRLYEPFHLKNFLSPVSLLDSRLIDSIEFYSGGFPAIYGDRMSAIVDAVSVRPAQPQYYELGLNLFHLSGLASREFSGGDGHALVSARRSNLGELASYSEKDFGEPHYADGSVRLDYRFDDRTDGSLQTLASLDEITARKSNGAQRSNARYQNVYAWGTLDRRWTDSFTSKLILSFTELSNKRRGDVDEPGLRFASVRDNREFHIAGLRIENELATGAVQQRFGAEIRRLWGEYDYSSAIRLEADYPFTGSPLMIGSQDVAIDPQGFESGAYWDARTRLGERWTFQGGLRVDSQTYDGSGDGAQLSPRLSALYALTARTMLRGSWGRFFQSHGINELQVEDGIDSFYRAQQADHSILSLEHAFDTGISLRVEAYRKQYRHVNPRFENLFDPLVLFPEAEFDRVRIAPDSASAEGIEVLLRAQPRGAWSGWLSYAFSRAEDRIDGRAVRRSWDQRHALNVGLTWARRGWTATLANSYHSGWPTTALGIDVGTSGVPQLDETLRNRQRLQSYNSLDIRVTRTFAMTRGALDAFVEVTNTFSRKNPCCVRYELIRAADGTASYERDVDSWLPLVPSVGVLWRY